MKAHHDIDSRVARFLEEEPDVKQIRIDRNARAISIGFYGLPSENVLSHIQGEVRREFGGKWDISIHSSEHGALFHEHRINDHIAEFHRAHPLDEPKIIWRRVRLPAWRNRPVPPPIIRDYRTMLLLAATCGLSTLTGFFLERIGFNTPTIAACFVIAYVTGGWFAIQDVWHALKLGKIDIHFLMVAVALGALFIRGWTEGATLLFLFSISNALEQFANYRTRRTIDSLLKAAPKKALRRDGSVWLEVAVEELEPGDEVLVKAGELFPVDGVVVEGGTSADESALTGESLPVAKRVGDSVDGGTLSIEGQCVIRVTRELQESALTRVVALIESAQQQKAPAQRFTDSFSRYYTSVALSLGAVVFAALLFLHHAPSDAFYRAMTVLVVASPCALVLSIPSAILVAIAVAARDGILFRGGVAIENLAGVTQFAFDKTGTLTKGTLVVSRLASFDSKSEDSLLRIGGSIAQFSTHPLARAIAHEVGKRRLPLLRATEFNNIPGLGMEALIDGKRILMGSRTLLREHGIRLPIIEPTSEAEVWIADSQALGVIYLRDEIRLNARRVIDFLKRRGSGWNRGHTRRIDSGSQAPIRARLAPRRQKSGNGWRRN